MPEKPQFEGLRDSLLREFSDEASLTIPKIVDTVKNFVEELEREERWTDDHTERLFGTICPVSDAQYPDEYDTAEPVVFSVLYYISLDDSRFDQWRWEFVNEMG